MEMKVMEFEKNLMTSLNELGKYFDGIYSDLDLCLSKGVEESVKSCVDSTNKMIAVSLIHMFCIITIFLSF